MFTFRLNSYQIVQYILIFCMSSEVIGGPSNKKCAEVNEYCLNHWDCCSNSCMSYLYRCSHGYNIYPYPFLGVSYKPTVTLDQILEQNFGSPNFIPASRFGDVNNVAVTDDQIVQQETAKSSTESTISENPTILHETSTVCVNDLEKKQNESHGLGEMQTTEATTKKSISLPACAEIGEKCYTRDDCCNKLCHGYLHKCVT